MSTRKNLATSPTVAAGATLAGGKATGIGQVRLTNHKQLPQPAHRHLLLAINKLRVARSSTACLKCLPHDCVFCRCCNATRNTGISFVKFQWWLQHRRTPIQRVPGVSMACVIGRRFNLLLKLPMCLQGCTGVLRVPQGHGPPGHEATGPSTRLTQ
jgi:hypothetical protein